MDNVVELIACDDIYNLWFKLFEETDIEKYSVINY